MGNAVCNDNQIHLEGNFFGNIHYKIFGEYLSTRNVLDSIADNLNRERENESNSTSNDLLRQSKLISIINSLPSFQVNAKYLNALKNKPDENKRCIVCMEEYELNSTIKTLPCCIHYFLFNTLL